MSRKINAQCGFSRGFQHSVTSYASLSVAGLPGFQSNLTVTLYLSHMTRQLEGAEEGETVIGFSLSSCCEMPDAILCDGGQAS